jgi:hypothetical protein
MARTGSTLRTMVTAGAAIAAGAPLWSQRPLLFGLLGLGALIFVVERRLSPWWLIPIGWVWVNTHGSFPLGLAWLAAVYVGWWIDDRRRPRHLDAYVGAYVASLVAAMVNPIGPRLVSFPLVVESKEKVFANIVEWRSPNFQSAGNVFALAFFALALVIILRRGAPWRDVFVMVGFLALGLISLRNLAPAAVVLAPILGRALRVTDEPTEAGGRPPPAADGDRPPPAGAGDRPLVRILFVALLLAGAVFVIGTLGTSAIDYSSYPTGAEHYLLTHGLLNGHRILTQDYVGDYRELVEGTRFTSGVFIDDRFDMYPEQVSLDYDVILSAKPPALAVLRKWNIDTVMWGRAAGLPDLLRLAGGWRTVYTDKNWEVLVRDPTVPPERLPS